MSQYDQPTNVLAADPINRQSPSKRVNTEWGRARTDVRTDEHSGKFYFKRAFLTSTGILVAWVAFLVVSLVAMFVLGLFIRGVTGIGNVGQNYSQSQNCGVNPNTGLIECR